MKSSGKIQISNGMYFAMLVNMLFAKAIGVTQGVMARVTGQDMWIATLLGTLQGLVIVYVTHLALRRSSGRDLIALGGALLGRWFGMLVALAMLVFFLAASGPILLTFVYHLKDYFLPEVPLWMFLFCGLAVGALGCHYGLEVMGRVALLGLLFLFLLNILITIGSTDEFDIRNLLPVLEHGLPSTIKASFQYDTDWALATMLAALVLPHVKDGDSLGGRMGAAGIAGSGMTIMIWSILESAVLSAEVTGQYTVSCMKLARNAHIGTFLQRYELIMIALYSVPILFEIMFIVYAVSTCLSRLFGLRSDKKTIVPAAALIGAFGGWVIGDHYRAMAYLEDVWPRIALPIAFGLPLLLFGLRMLKKRGAAARER